LVAGSGGAGFLVTTEDLLSRVKAGKTFMTLEENEEPICPALLASRATHVAALSAKGRLLVFSLDEVKTMPRGRGVILMGLDRAEKLQAVALITLQGLTIHGHNRSNTEVTAALTAKEVKSYVHGRARKGAALDYRMKPYALDSVTESE